jgi:hypothetical protein
MKLLKYILVFVMLSTGIASAGEITITLVIDGKTPASVTIYTPVTVSDGGQVQCNDSNQEIVVIASTKKDLAGAIMHLQAVSGVKGG